MLLKETIRFLKINNNRDKTIKEKNISNPL